MSASNNESSCNNDSVISEIFDDKSDSAFVVVGSAGSGKTTLLLNALSKYFANKEDKKYEEKKEELSGGKAVLGGKSAADKKDVLDGKDVLGGKSATDKKNVLGEKSAADKKDVLGGEAVPTDSETVSTDSNVLVVYPRKKDAKAFEEKLIDNAIKNTVPLAFENDIVKSIGGLAFQIINDFSDKEIRFLSGAESQNLIDECIKEATDKLRNQEIEFSVLNYNLISTGRFNKELRSFTEELIDFGISPENLKSIALKYDQPVWRDVSEIYSLYYYSQIADKAFDHSMRSLFALECVKNYPDKQSFSQAKEHRIQSHLNYDYIFVDDYQNISRINQLLLIELAKKSNAKLILIGNKNESTQEFKGAPVDFLETAKEEGIEYKKICLDGYNDNRSIKDQITDLFEDKSREEKTRFVAEEVPSVEKEKLSVAEEKNFVGEEKALVTEKKNSDVSINRTKVSHKKAINAKCKVYGTSDEEAEGICDQIKRLRMQKGLNYGDFAVVSRSTKSFGEYISGFTENKIPIKYIRLYKSIKDEPLYIALKKIYEFAGKYRFGSKSDITEESAKNEFEEIENSILCSKNDAENLIRIARNNINANAVNFLSHVWKEANVAEDWQDKALRSSEKNIANHNLDIANILFMYAKDFSAGSSKRKKIAQLVNSPDAVSVMLQNGNRSDQEQVSGNRSDRGPSEGSGMNAENTETTFGEFIDYIDKLEVKPSISNSREDAVSLVTPSDLIGNVFDTVFVTDVNRDSWPNVRVHDSLLRANDLPLALFEGVIYRDKENTAKEVYDQEARLFYIACSHASNNLIISAVKNDSCFPSDFFEIAKKTIETEADAEKGNATEADAEKGNATEADANKNIIAGTDANRNDGDTAIDNDVLSAADEKKYRFSDFQSLITYVRQKLLSDEVSEEDKKWFARFLNLINNTAGTDGYFANPITWYGSEEPTNNNPLYGENEKVYLSPSGIEKLTTCPLKWFFSKVAIENGHSVAQLLGTEIHSVASRINENELAEECSDLIFSQDAESISSNEALIKRILKRVTEIAGEGTAKVSGFAYTGTDQSSDVAGANIDQSLDVAYTGIDQSSDFAGANIDQSSDVAGAEADKTPDPSDKEAGRAAEPNKTTVQAINFDNIFEYGKYKNKRNNMLLNLAYFFAHTLAGKRKFVVSELPIKDVKVADNLCLSGSIDRIQLAEDNDLLLIDFKTSKTVISAKEAEANPQLLCYQLMLSAQYEGNGKIALQDLPAQIVSAAKEKLEGEKPKIKSAQLVYLGVDSQKTKSADYEKARREQSPVSELTDIEEYFEWIGKEIRSAELRAFPDYNVCNNCPAKICCPATQEGENILC